VNNEMIGEQYWEGICTRCGGVFDFGGGEAFHIHEAMELGLFCSEYCADKHEQEWLTAQRQRWRHLTDVRKP